jgi:hypothetical protein
MEILKYALFLLFNNILRGASMDNNTCLNDEKKYFFTFKPISNDYNVNFSIFKSFNSFEDLRLNCQKRYEVEGLIEFIPKNEILIGKSILTIESTYIRKEGSLDYTTRVVMTN